MAERLSIADRDGSEHCKENCSPVLFFLGLVAFFFGLPLLIGAIAYYQKRRSAAFYAHPIGSDNAPGVSPETQAGLFVGLPLKHP